MDDGTIEKLQKLAGLRDSGAITESEFEALKADVLSGAGTSVVRDSLERPSVSNIGPYVSWWLSQRSKRFIANLLAVVLIGAVAWLFYEFFWPI